MAFLYLAEPQLHLLKRFARRIKPEQNIGEAILFLPVVLFLSAILFLPEAER